MSTTESAHNDRRISELASPNQQSVTPPAAKSSNESEEIDEHSPLIPKSQSQRTPLPWKSIAILMIVRLSEPVASTVIFPFVNELVARDDQLHAAPSQVGYYSGAIESIFMLCQALTVLQWGRLSDRIGRKPVLLIGCFGTALSILSFGLSRHVPAMIVTRALSGVLNGNVSVIKAAFGELTDSTNEALAFAILPLGWSVGAALAPALGGWTFDRMSSDYPALLPCALAALVPTISFVVCLFCFEESLPSSARKAHAQERQHGKDTKKAGIWHLIKTPNNALLLANYGFVALIGMAATALIPLAGWTDVSLGGLGLSEEALGTALSLQSIGLVACQSLLFPILQRRLGTLGLHRASVPFFTGGVFLLPVAAWFAQKHERSAELFMFGAALTLLVIANLCYGCLMLMVTNSAPSRTTLATMNGVVQTLASAMRAVGPATASSLYALSIHRHVLGGQLVWVVLVLLGFTLIALSWALKPAQGWRQTESVQ